MGIFCREAAGFQDPEASEVLSRGLIEGVVRDIKGDVHYFLIHMGDFPSFTANGAGHSVIAGLDEHQGRAPFVGAWPNAVQAPSARLAELFGRVKAMEELEQGFRLEPFLLEKGYPLRGQADDSAAKKVYADLEKEIELPDGSKGRLIDLIAVLGYQHLQKK